MEKWCFFFFQAEDGIRAADVTGVQTCALPISGGHPARPAGARRLPRRGLGTGLRAAGGVMAALLELSGVTAGYGGARVLDGVDLAVERESITCVVGPNGAGKSTLLKAVSGLLRPWRGTITLDGTVISGLGAAAVLGRGVVQVPQQRGLFPSLTVRENVLMGAYVLRRDRSLVRRR